MDDVDAGAAAAVAENWRSWGADVVMMVRDESRRTGKPEIEVASEHLLRLQLTGVEPFILLVWAEYVAWLAGRLKGPAKRRWDIVAR